MSSLTSDRGIETLLRHSSKGPKLIVVAIEELREEDGENRFAPPPVAVVTMEMELVLLALFLVSLG